MIKKQGGKLVGPARAFVNLFHFDSNGLVDSVEVSVTKLKAGLPLLEKLHPRLRMHVTQIGSEKAAQLLAQLDLRNIDGVDFRNGQLTDRLLQIMSPAILNCRALFFQGAAKEKPRVIGSRKLSDEALIDFLAKTTRLEELEVDRAEIVLRAPVLPHLRVLDVSHKPVPSAEALKQLAAKYPRAVITPSLKSAAFLRRWTK